MRIAVTSDGISELDLVSERFARCNYFIIYDSVTLKFEAVENTAKEEASGAGGKAVKILNDYDCDIVLGPKVGPKAMDALKAFEISIYDYNGAKTPKDAVYLYLGKELSTITTPSSSKHQ